MPDIDAETVFARNPEAAFRIVDGTALIVMPREAKMLTLNAVGTRVWDLLDGRTPAQIARAIAAEFEVDEATALADALAFLATLRERGMVVEKRAAG
jgi:hypothetical protein